MMMKTAALITRRGAIITGFAAAGGVILTRYPKDLPPTYGNLLRMGDTLTYAAHRTLLPGQSLVKEFSASGHHLVPARPEPRTPASEKAPLGEAYGKLQSGSFADWRLSVEGRVSKPRSFSLTELKQLPSRTQITRHTCEEGWTAIGQWTGVPLSLVLESAGILPPPGSSCSTPSMIGLTVSICWTRCTPKPSWPTA